jgi:nucleotide-binding universal stress UspA family protein
MIGDLIIGFDGSDAGRDGLALGRALALATYARVTVVYARSYMALTPDLRETGEDLPWRAAAERVLDEARAALADVPVAGYRAVAERSAAHALHSAADVADAGIIVIGSTHRSGLGRIAPGTTADQILQAAPCAVAVAPAGYATAMDDHALRRIGAAVDGAAESDRVTRVTAGLARRVGATVRLITVVEHAGTRGRWSTVDAGDAPLAGAAPRRAIEVLERATVAVGGGLRIERRLCAGHPAEELIAESGDLDLLVVGSRGFGPVRRIVPGSTSAQVVRAAECPVVVLPRRASEHVAEIVSPVAGGAVPIAER